MREPKTWLNGENCDKPLEVLSSLAANKKTQYIVPLNEAFNYVDVNCNKQKIPNSIIEEIKYKFKNKSEKLEIIDLNSSSFDNAYEQIDSELIKTFQYDNDRVNINNFTDKKEYFQYACNYKDLNNDKPKMIGNVQEIKSIVPIE